MCFWTTVGMRSGNGGCRMMDRRAIMMALGLSVFGKGTLKVSVEKSVLLIRRVEAEVPHTPFEDVRL